MPANAVTFESVLVIERLTLEVTSPVSVLELFGVTGSFAGVEAATVAVFAIDPEALAARVAVIV